MRRMADVLSVWCLVPMMCDVSDLMEESLDSAVRQSDRFIRPGAREAGHYGHDRKLSTSRCLPS
jgi:hypothetical protein